MASREETLLFLVDVQVRNSAALKQLNAEMDELQDKMDHHMASLNKAAATLQPASPDLDTIVDDITREVTAPERSATEDHLRMAQALHDALQRWRDEDGYDPPLARPAP
jgi:ABC-type transporter Mla subunit MlaD